MTTITLENPVINSLFKEPRRTHRYTPDQASPSQWRAIQTTVGPLLIIAGPGSGKTFTLVERIVYLIQEYQVPPEALLVVTFTDKAARTAPTKTEDITARLQRRQFSALMLVAEIARYLNRDPLEIEDLLASTAEGIELILDAVNQFNDLLYDDVIPRLFRQLYDLIPTEQHTEQEVELIKVPEKGYYEVTARKDMIVRQDDSSFRRYQEKSFHLDAYCFDSQPEKTLFWDLLKEGRIQKIYFTGMLTHGQSDFYIQYVDPDSHAVRNYYPDFVVQADDGGYLLVEVKGDNRLDDPVTKAKADYARQLASASRMDYRVIRGSDAYSHQWQGLLE